MKLHNEIPNNCCLLQNWCIYTYVNTYTHTHIHTYIHTYTHTNIIHTYPRTYTHTYTYIHSYIYTYIHTHIHFDRQKPIEQDLTKVDTILQHAKREGAIIAMDSNARSTSWHDTTTNNRGKRLEDYITSKQLHIMNEPSTKTTFENRVGKSNIDLTLVTNLIRRITDWKISDEESNSDHSISYDIKTDINHKNDGTEI